MTLVRGVVDRFLRRSGSRVSILNACRHQVPTWTLSLRVIPIPSRTTQQSTRPRASDRSMCCQPGNRHGLPASETDRRSHYSTRMQLRWNHARSANIPTPPLTHGAGRQGNTFSFRSREKNVLDISSYRSGDSAQNPGQAASSDRTLAQKRIAFMFSSRKPRSSSSQIRRSDKSIPNTCVSREERNSYLRSMSLRHWVK